MHTTNNCQRFLHLRLWTNLTLRTAGKLVCINKTRKYRSKLNIEVATWAGCRPQAVTVVAWHWPRWPIPTACLQRGIAAAAAAAHILRLSFSHVHCTNQAVVTWPWTQQLVSDKQTKYNRCWHCLNNGIKYTYDAVLNAETKLIFDVWSFDENFNYWCTWHKLQPHYCMLLGSLQP